MTLPENNVHQYYRNLSAEERGFREEVAQLGIEDITGDLERLADLISPENDVPQDDRDHNIEQLLAADNSLSFIDNEELPFPEELGLNIANAELESVQSGLPDAELRGQVAQLGGTENLLSNLIVLTNLVAPEAHRPQEMQPIAAAYPREAAIGATQGLMGAVRFSDLGKPLNIGKRKPLEAGFSP